MGVLKGRVALITGAGQGIGKGIAKKFASLGIDLALCGRTPETLEETCREAREYGVRAEAVKVDLLKEEEIRVAVDKVIGIYGRLDILVNNAGIVQAGPMLEVETEEFDRVIATNVRAPFLMMKYCYPYLKAGDRPDIINICSVVAEKGYPDQSIYVASKHALLGLSKSFANEVYKENIRIHCICPGGVYTEMVAKVSPELDPAGLMLPSDVAEVAAFFVEHRTNAVVDQINLHRSNKAPFA